MRAFSLVVSVLIYISSMQAQNYLINFTGSGESTSFDSIQVENLTQGTRLSLNGSDILQLIEIVGINKLIEEEKAVKIYPNPMITSTIVEFSYPNSQTVSLEIFDERGVLIANQSTHVPQGRQRYEISGLNTGIYTIVVSTEDRKYAAKLISLGNISGNTTIKHQYTDKGLVLENDLKSTKDLIQMQYNYGEIILFKGFSGIYTRVLTLLPSQSQTLNFEFTLCSDEDGNNYSVVTIGSQTWMAENLKTTKYSDGSDILNVTDTIWGYINTPAYCWYDNEQTTYGSIYGALYNWYTVETGNLCPTGWHVPSHEEWTTFTNYLGGSNGAGGKLKESGSMHWNSPNTGATNETGFTGLPGGVRGSDGYFYNVGYICVFWSSTEFDNKAWVRKMMFNNGNIDSQTQSEPYGLSVRCLRN